MELKALGAPSLIDTHWDDAGRRTRLCAVAAYRSQDIEAPASVCAWCDMEQSPRGRHYVAVLAPRVDEGRLLWELGLVQLPLAFVVASDDRLRRGRILRGHDLAHPDKKPRWQLGGICPDIQILPPAFNLWPALMRITGMDKLPAIPDCAERPETLPFRRQA